MKYPHQDHFVAAIFKQCNGMRKARSHLACSCRSTELEARPASPRSSCTRSPPPSTTKLSKSLRCDPHLKESLRPLARRPDTLFVHTRSVSGAVAVVDALNAFLVGIPVGKLRITSAQKGTSVTIPTGGIRPAWGC